MRRSSIQLLCAVIFFPVANVFGAELDCWFILATPHFLCSCSVFTGLAVPTFFWLHVGPRSTEGRLPLRHANRYRCCSDRWLFWCQRSATPTLKERPNSRINYFNGSRSRSTAPVLDLCRRPLCLWLEVFSAFFSLKFSKWWSFSGHLKYTFQNSFTPQFPSRWPGAHGHAVIFSLNLYKQDNQSLRIRVLKRNLLVLCIAFRGICFTTC